MKTKLLLATVLSLVIIMIAAAGASIFLTPQKQTPPNTLTPIPTTPLTPAASATETPSPTVTEEPKENLLFKEVNMRANYNFTIKVSCSSEHDITLIQAIIKDGNENNIDTNDFNITVPIGGEIVNVPIHLSTSITSPNYPLTITLVTENGNTFTSPEIHLPSYAQPYGN
jgi:hypothetical protein